MKNIYPYTLDWAALPGLAILILLIYVFHTQQRSYRLFSFPGSEMKGGKKKKQRQNQKKTKGKKKIKESSVQESSSNDKRGGRGPSLPGVSPFSHPLKDQLFFPSISF